MSTSRANGLLLAITLVLFAGYLPFAPVRMYDFRAFYCAGRAVVTHADPYREHPLHECERQTTAPGMQVDRDDVTVPVPLPGYAIALFALLAVLPFGLCAILWIVASIAAVLLTIELLHRVLDVPLARIAVAIAMPAAIVAVPMGQTAPFVGVAIAACAYALKRGFHRPAAVAAIMTALDPAVAIVLCATLLIAVPPTRVTILAGAVVLAGISLLALGGAANAEYLRAVVHAHAIGNVAERSQFSAAHFAWVAGMTPNWALGAGELWYVLAVVAGVLIARRLCRTYGYVALALVPPAFAVFGGTYVHFSQIVLAIPAYLMMMQSAPRKFSWMPSAVFFLAVPWLVLAAFPPFAIALVALAIIYSRTAAERPVGLRLGLSCAALLIVFFGIALANVRPPVSAFHANLAENGLAEISWSRYIAWRDQSPSGIFLLLQIPTVVAFAACLARVSRSGFMHRGDSEQLRATSP